MSQLASTQTMYELKEKAKWSESNQDKKSAIKEITTYGSDAIPALEEIFIVAMSDEVRVACVDAMDAIRGTASKQEATPLAETATTQVRT